MAKIGSLEPLLASKRITDSPFIKGGYFPIDKLTDLEDMRVATDTQDGTIVHGSLCYCREDGKFHQFNGESWVEAPGATLKMSDIDDELGNELPEGRVYNAGLHDILKSKYRLYTEKSVNDGGGVSPLNYMSANAVTDRLFSPVGYTDFNKMCKNNGLDPDKAVEETADQRGHYVTRVVNGVTEYYPRLTSVVKRTYDDNVRTSTPVDSADAVPYGYFKKYTFDFGNDKVKSYQVVRRGNTGQLYSTPVVINPATDPNAKDGENFSLRTKQNELLAYVDDESPDNALVNKAFLKSKALDKIDILNGDMNTSGSVKKTVADTIAEHLADAPGDFNTLKEMSDWISDHSGSAAEMNSAIQANAADIAQTKASIPSALSQLGDDETHRVVTDTEKATWNAKSNFSGSYNDLSNKPTIPTVPTISGTVSKGSGGISTGKVYNNASVATVLEDLLFPYVAPTGVTFSIYTEDGTAVSGTSEYGKQITVTKAKISFTKGSKDITSVKIGTTKGGNDLYEATSVTSGNFITLHTSVTFDGTTGGKIHCTISDGNTTIDDRSVNVSYAYYNYAVVTNDTTKPTSPQQSDKVIWGSNRGTGYEADIPTQDNTYIWFLMPNTNKTTIQQYAMNQWNNMSTTYEGTVDFTTTMGKQVTYHAYRTDKLMSDTAKYRIN